jgi:hypothetical protein
MKTINYTVGDLSNGDFATYETEQEALEALKEAIEEGTLENIQVIGEEGCLWQSDDDAREAAESFFYVRKHTVEYDEEGDVELESYEMVAGNIQ